MEKEQGVTRIMIANYCKGAVGNDFVINARNFSANIFIVSTRGSVIVGIESVNRVAVCILSSLISTFKKNIGNS